MKFLVLVFVQLLTVYTAWSAVFTGGNFSHPDYPGKCFYNFSEPPTIISLGETVTIKGQCMEAICLGDFSMNMQSCSPVTGPKEHMKPENLSLPYPECCPDLMPLE